MAIFRKGRRSRGGEATPAPTAASGPRSPAPADHLRDRLREIAQSTPAEDALEPALHAIIEVIGAQAGAVCLYDTRYAVLRLAAEVGLSDEGCKRLRNVRRGDPSVWDMPLHGLLNRRAYLIESAPKNRYVPRLVEPASSMRTVACVPIYAGANPIGTVILVSLAPRTLAERDIRMLERPAAELAKIIEAVRQKAGQADEVVVPVVPSPHLAPDLGAVVSERDRLRSELAARLAERARLAAELAARAGEAERLRAALESAGEERSRLAAAIERAQREASRAEALEAALAAAEGERVRLATSLEAVAAERVGQTRAETDLARARDEAARTAEAAASELAAAQAARLVAEMEAARRTAELREEVARLQARLIAAETAAAREREVARTRERDLGQVVAELRAAAVREDRLQVELAAGAGGEPGTPGADRVRAAEAARVEAEAATATARDALASSQAVIEALEVEAEQAAAEHAQFEAERTALRAATERAGAELVEARAREAAAAARLAEVMGEIDGLRGERDQLAAAAREQQAESLTLAARLETLAAERDRLRDGLAALGAERDRLAGEIAEAAAARGRLDDAFMREAAERARLTEALAVAQTALGELEAVQAEALARTAEIERLTAERDQIAGERDAALARVGTAGAAEAMAEVPTMRVVTVAPPGPPRGRARTIEAGQRLVVVLDVDGAWENVALDGHAIQVFAPDDDLVARVAAATPARILVNLTMPGALGTLAALRAASPTARFWGCLAEPAADRALALGMVEPAARPLEPDAVLEILAHYTARGTRIVTAGTDVDALMSLRQALARRGASVSMAWDAKQAGELLGVVRPEVVIVDLALPRRDGYGIVAQLGRVEPTPAAILVPGNDDMAAGFFAAFSEPAHSSRLVSLERLVGAACERSEASAAERRQKVRVVGRK